MTTIADSVEDADNDRVLADLQSTGERIESLLDASSAGGPLGRDRAEELVRLVVELYGAGLERMLDILYDAGCLDDMAIDALVADELVASLLLVHGLHPEGVTDRVERALEEVRPYLGTHGGDVELIEVDEDGTVRLRLLGSCDGCVSSAATLTLAVEGAIRDAAPEVGAIEVETPTADATAMVNSVTGNSATATSAQNSSRSTDTLIPIESLRVRRAGVATDGVGQWQSVPSLDSIEAGELRSATVAEVAIVACRVGGDLFAFRYDCPSCGDGLGTATIERRLGGPIGDAVLRCAHCGSHFDVRRAGACIERVEEHLDPLPLLIRRGSVEVALPGSVHA